MKKKTSQFFLFMKRTPLGFMLLFLGIVVVSAGIFLPFSKADPSSSIAFGTIGDTLLNDDAYIDQASMVEDTTTESKKAIVTGSEPFDSEYGEDISTKLKDGDDNSPKNNIVRTFDMIDYMVSFTTKIQNGSDVVAYKKGRIYFEFVLPYSSEQAIFETKNMRWLESKTGSYYQIIEVDHSNEDGSISKWQVLKGSFMIMPSDGEETSIGNHYRELNVTIRVLRMKNKEVIQPYFTFWLQGNDVFQGQDFTSSIDLWYHGNFLITFSKNQCHTHLMNDGVGIEEYKTITPPKVTVTAAPRYNISIVQGHPVNDQLLGTFDFSEGNEFAQNTDKGLIDGRLVGYGITIELSGKSKEHGLFGVEIPTGDITFDLRLKSIYNGQDVSLEYEPLIYSIHGNYNYGGTLPNGRDSKVGVVSVVPFNYGSSDERLLFNRCYNGGDWQYVIDGDVIHITVHDSAIDFNRFPYANVNDSSSQYIYYDSNVNYWQIQKAIFSSGAVWVVQDFYNSNSGSGHFKKYVSDQYGDDHFDVIIESSNSKITSIGGVVSTTEMITTDQWASHTIELERKGYFDGRILPVKYNYQSYDDAITDDGDGWQSGRYIHTAGEKLTIEYYTSHDSAEGFYTGVGYDALVKWDDLFFEPDGTVQNECYSLNQLDYKFLYGAKPDKTGWDHKGVDPYHDEYDWEMKAAVVDDLIYFESLEELKKSGYVPVALLIEHRGVASPSMNHIHAFIKGRVKKDVKTGYTYMATYNLRGWNKSTIRDLVAEKNGIEIHSPGDYNKITEEMYDDYARQYIPSRSDSNVTSYDVYPDAFQVYDIRDSLLADYYKARYDENGLIAGPGYFNAGLSCYVSDYMINVGVKTAQSGANEDGSKRVYDLDEGQRIADFEILPSIVTGFQSSDERKLNTTIIIEAILESNLTFIDGSSRIGGNYQESTQGQGVITGGKIFHPSIIKNEDGTTTLRWNLSDLEFVVGHDISVDKIYYSCQIGNLSSEENDVQNEQTIRTTVRIRSREDYIRPYLEANNNVATNTIYIQKSNALSLFNSADKISNELGQSIGFLMSYKNNQNVTSPTILVNGLPYNGDGHSSFHGDLKVVELSVGSSKVEENTSVLEDFNFYYTTDSSYQGKLSRDLENENFLDTNIWKKLNLGSMDANQTNSRLPNTSVLIPDNFSPVLIVAVGNMKPQQKLEMHITFQLPSNQPGDFVANYVSQGKINSYSYAYYISRMLEGKVWLDTNRNGLQGQQEGEISGLKVTLLKLKDGGNQESEIDYEPYKMNIAGTEIDAVVSTGEQLNILTGEIIQYESSFPSDINLVSVKNGSYRFYNVPAGVYGVRIESGDTTYLYNYRVSPINQGSNDEIDSDGIGTYDANDELEKVFIGDILIENIENMEIRYQESRYHDVGLYGNYRFQYKKVKSENLKQALSGAKFSLYQLDCHDSSHTVEDHLMVNLSNVDTCFKYLGDSVSDSHGMVIFRHLSNTYEYRLVEIKTPFGRVKPIGQWKVLVGEEYQIITLGSDPLDFIDQDGIWVLPNQLIQLPITGGSGITLYIFIGWILVSFSIGLLLLFYEKRRKRNSSI